MVTDATVADGYHMQVTTWVWGRHFNAAHSLLVRSRPHSEATRQAVSDWCRDLRLPDTCLFSGMLGGKLIRRAMVVAPKTLLGQWVKELTVCGLGHSIFEYYGSSAAER